MERLAGSWLGSVSGAVKLLHTIRDKPPNFFKFTHLKKQLNSKNKAQTNEQKDKTNG